MASDFASADHKTADALERIANTLSRIEKILDTGLPGYVARRDNRPTVSQVVRAQCYWLQPKERHEPATMEG